VSSLPDLRNENIAADDGVHRTELSDPEAVKVIAPARAVKPLDA